jgi:uncharacterized protein YdaU (DUF1376 family)
MHYYSFNIGDYASHTRNLSLLEDLAYRRLLDEYYLHEHPLNVSVTAVARQIGMREHEDCIKFILDSFFIFTESGWINTRADREIEHFKGKIAQASNAGKASAERRLNVRSTGVQPNNKQEPITNKHKPINNITTTPEGVSQDIWDSFVEQRKKSRAVITETVINSIQKEANKAGWTLEMALAECAARGWRGFKAEWVRTESEKQFNQPQSKAMLGVMLVQQEIDRLKNEGTENEIFEN